MGSTGVRRFLHDDKTDGVLAAIGRALAAGPAAEVRPESGEDLLIAEEGERVAGTPEEAEALLARIGRDLGEEWVRRVLRLLCSEEPGSARVALRVLALALERGPEVMGFHANPDVRKANAVERRVSGEVHRLKGLLRFRRLATGRLWGPVEPRHNVVAMIAPHFQRRLGAERWLIHDVVRGFGVAGEPGGAANPWDSTAIETELRGGLDPSEAAYQGLWRTYFDAIAIRTRANPRAQRRAMPVRYWRHLVESPGGARARGGPA
jgi:probable DNA metabolism protein